MSVPFVPRQVFYPSGWPTVFGSYRETITRQKTLGKSLPLGTRKIEHKEGSSYDSEEHHNEEREVKHVRHR